MKERKRRFIVIVGILLAITAVSLQGQLQTREMPPPPSEPVPAVQGERTRALDVLETLDVKGRAPRTGYAREQFDAGWAEIEGCDMRNIILQRDLVELRLDEDNCTVLSGRLRDPYTGKHISFTRGQSTSADVQIDHVVALSDAWQKGAQQLDESQRAQFANDPLNLLAVDGPTNQKKSDADAATWLPPHREYRCRYVARQIAVKQSYTLWVTAAEYDAMKRVLMNCPDQILPIEVVAGSDHETTPEP